MSSSVNPPKSRIKFGFININGIRTHSKTHKVSDFFNTQKLDIMFLTETKLLPNSELSLTPPPFIDIRLDENEVSRFNTGPKGREGIVVLLNNDTIRPYVTLVHTCPTKRWILLKVTHYYIVCCYFNPQVDNSEIEQMFSTIYNKVPNIDTDNLIVVGDFNARMKQSGDHTTNTRGTWFRENIIPTFALQLVKPTIGTLTTAKGGGGGVTDLLIHTIDSHIHIHDYTIETHDLLSDHKPLTWTLPILDTYTKPTITRYNLGRLQIPEFRNSFSSHLHSTFNNTLTHMETLSHTLSSTNSIAKKQSIINSMEEALSKWIHNAASDTIGIAQYTIRSTQTPNVNPQPTTNMTQIHQALSSTMGHTTYYKEVSPDTPQHISDEYVNKMAQRKNQRLFLKHTKAMKKRATQTSNNQLNPTQMQHYEQYYKTKSWGAPPQGKKVTTSTQVVNHNTATIDFSTKAIQQATYRIANGKAAGPDNIPVEFLKHKMDLTSQLLHILFTASYENAMIPNIWTKANVCLIYKQKGSPTDVANYRPISLTCITRRIYERLIIQQLTPHTEAILEINQGGFRLKQSTLHQAYAVHEAMLKHPKALHAFLDISAAYDSVNRDILWNDMHRYGYPEHIIAICQSLFDFNTATLLINGAKSNDIECKRGLLQGSSLSPLLFNIYINELIKRLNSLPHKVYITSTYSTNNHFFADDGHIIALTPWAMQACLDTCSDWATEYGQQFAPSKCVMICTNKSLHTHIFTIQNGTIPFQDTTIYLGIETDGKGLKFAEKQQARCAAAIKQAQFFHGKGMNETGWRVKNRVLIYKIFLRPMFEYGIPLIDRQSQTIIKHMEHTQNTILNLMLSSPPRTSIGAKLKLLQLETITARQMILQFRFISSLNRQQANPTTPATITWSTMSPPSSYQQQLRNNTIYQYSQHHTKEETEHYISQYKSDVTTTMYDRTDNNGHYNTSGSIDTPQVPTQQTIYLSEFIDEEVQRNIINLRLGIYTFHQVCAKCEDELVSREHATQCSGEADRLEEIFAEEYEEYQQSQVYHKIIFQDFLMNRMDTLYVSRDTKATQIMEEMNTTVKNIRSTVSGFIQSDTNNKQWYFSRREQQYNYYYNKKPKKQKSFTTLLKIRNDPRTSEEGHRHNELQIQEYFSRHEGTVQTTAVDSHRRENTLPP